MTQQPETLAEGDGVFDAADPRSALAGGGAAGRPPGPVGKSRTVEASTDPAGEQTATGSRTWWIHDNAFLVGYTDLVAGDSVHVLGSLTEHLLVVASDSTAVTVTAGAESVEVDEPAVVVCPPGDTSVTARDATALVRALPAAAAAAVGRSAEQDAAGPAAVVAGSGVGAAPPGGFALRVYPLSGVPVDADRFGRIFRCSSVMVNLLARQVGPRDTSSLSPHSHAEFAQCSVTLAGRYVHHLRTPWTPRLDEWRDDEHRECTSPSLTVIPAGMQHTTRAVGAGEHDMLDVFAPPRADFCAMPGWVLNAAEYPYQAG